MTYTIDSLDRLVSATGMGFGWDANGNMVYMDDGVYEWNYTYNPLNRLVKVYKDSVLSARYMYDAGGRRVRSWDAVGGAVDYVYSGLNVVDEVSGGAHEKHIYAGSMHLASYSSGTVEYFHVDHLGSTRLKTGASGSAIYESNYEPYGPGIGESGSEEFRYTGKQEDPTGLYYYGARYYDPVTGRFTTRDSVFGDLTDPQSLNRYSYCRNNPMKYIDPDGNIFWFVVGMGLVGAAINGGYYWATHKNNFDAREFGIALGTGFIAGSMSGVVAVATGGTATIAAMTIAEKAVTAVTVSTILTAPTCIAADMVAREVTGLKQKTGAEVLNEWGEKSIESSMSAVLSSTDVLNDLETSTRYTVAQVTVKIVREIIDRWWEQPMTSSITPPYYPSQVTLD